MSDRCCWPRCQQGSAGNIRYDNKVYSLCEHHCDLVQHEDVSVMKRSRSKVGMPPPRKISGEIISACSPRSGARCAIDGCGMPACMVVYTPSFPKESGGVPACNSHYASVEKDDIKWDGVWYRFLPACKLDRVPLFGDNEEVPRSVVVPVTDAEPPPEEPQEGNALVEVIEEGEDLTEEESSLVSDLMARLAAGELDAD